ncbi:MAG TPA: AAA family ATPase, partial [Pseudonocardiaceae bacterium]|nr:AAA family ATPase [Pseudonocardiaceae bacterium]
MHKTTGDLGWPLIGRQAETAVFDEWLADPDRHGIVLCGPQGVGKSRLAEEFVQRATKAGFLAGRAVATAAAAAVPLGAIAHLLPDSANFADPADALTAIVDAWRGRRRIVLVDDLHLLDLTSAMLLRRLTDARAVRVVATMRTGGTGPLTVDKLAGHDIVTRLDVHPLGEDGVEELLRGALAQPVATRAVRLLFRASEGNPLYLREITAGALGSGALVFTGELWQLDESRPLGTPLLADLIERRLHAVDPAARPVLDVLALCGPQSPTDLLDLAPAHVTADLAVAGLVRVLRNGQRGLVMLAHPMYGEVIRDRIPQLLRVEILLSQAERLRGRGSKRRQDALNIATWELAATGTSDPELLRKAADLAFHANDNCHVTALLTALPPRHHTTTTRLQLGQAHYLLGRWPAAESVLAEAAAAAGSDTERLVVSTFRVTNLLWGNADTEAARTVNDAVRGHVHPAHPVVRLNEAMALLVSRRPAPALALLDEVGADPELSAYQGAWLRHTTFRASALALLGRATEAVDLARKIHAKYLGTNSDAPDLSSHPSTHLAGLVHALTETGRLTEAVRVGRTAFDDLVAAGLPTPRLWLVVLLGRAEWLAGHPRSARRWFTEAVSLGQYV